MLLELRPCHWFTLLNILITPSTGMCAGDCEEVILYVTLAYSPAPLDCKPQQTQWLSAVQIYTYIISIIRFNPRHPSRYFRKCIT